LPQKFIDELPSKLLPLAFYAANNATKVKLRTTTERQ